MAQTATLHVKLAPETDSRLAVLAKRRKTSKGQLVRDAISVCYQPDFEDLPVTQRRALAAYEGDYISLGKLAEAMGLHPLAMRSWLAEHNLPEKSAFHTLDADHA
jgi:predicted DNA-binding protein